MTSGIDNRVPPAPAVRMTGATLAYNDTVVFDGVSLDLGAGEWTVLLGPSGVGKTTLLRLLAGLEGHATGEIVCSDHAHLTRRVAYLAQQDLLLPWLSIEDNVMIGHRLRAGNTPGLHDRARNLLNRVGIGRYANALPSACSGGMRQRAALVRTLIEDRPVVLMDEPFSALDAISRLQLQDLAAELLKNRTVLLVTHDPLEALRLGNAIYVMTGRPATFGTPIRPPGETPRDAGNPQLIALQADLLSRLSDAAKATAL
jgi:putative hydroxymethylpyrimidine transport system ATP-binding protein